MALQTWLVASLDSSVDCTRGWHVVFIMLVSGLAGKFEIVDSWQLRVYWARLAADTGETCGIRSALELDSCCDCASGRRTS